MAERLLPTDVKSEMTNNFEKANASTINNEYHDKYLKMVEELSTLYNI
jgi:hemerythrin-like domain-containing protein